MLGESDVEVAHNNAANDSSSDVNVSPSPHAQHRFIQFVERNSLVGIQIPDKN